MRGATADAGALARAAAERMAKHVRHQREQRPLPSAFALGWVAQAGAPDTALPGLGHNSASFGIDAEQRSEAIDIPALVARATAALSEHVASRRKSLTVLKFRPGSSAGKTDSDPQ